MDFLQRDRCMNTNSMEPRIVSGTKEVLSVSSTVRLPGTSHCADISIIWTTSCDKDCAGRLTNATACAGAEGRRTDSREGDFGGPLVCGDVLQGIVSWGDATTKPTVYTKVCSYLEWIKETIKRN
ncbi:kallikrein-15-like [Kogia breviceps]|uniref:kallikrein-15-like n=1 Tax=Kogia breviceps TaxID=27615 RepID=UPI0034D18049